MRVKLTLQTQQRDTRLPLNINHAIAGLIYRILGAASADFATLLHEEGFADAADRSRRFKLFTFSRLEFRRSHLHNGRIVLDDPNVTLQLSSPVSAFIEHFVTGLFQCEAFQLLGHGFVLTAAETLPVPDFSATNSFRALSPITETVRDEGAPHPRFLSPADDWSEIMQRNLLRKYRALYGSDPADTQLRWQWDQDYLQRLAAQGRRASVLIDINGIKVRGWLVPFTVEGSRELIELGYETGFGSRNSMGFGMGEIIGSRK